LLEHLGKQIGREVEGLSWIDEGQDAGLEDVDPGVDVVGKHLAPAGLLQKTAHALLLVRDDHAKFQRIADAGQDNGGGGLVLPVKLGSGGEVEIGQCVAADDQKGLGQVLFDALDAAGRAQRLVLDRVEQSHLPVRAVAEVGHDLVGQVVQSGQHGSDAVTPQKLKGVFHDRLVADRNKRLRPIDREGTKP
jgi:hypothetical protein